MNSNVIRFYRTKMMSTTIIMLLSLATCLISPSRVSAQDLVAESWTDTHDGGNGHDYFHGVAIDSQGNMIAAGYIKGLNSPEHNTDGYIKKYPLDGSDPWEETLDMGPVAGAKLDSYDNFAAVAVDSEDNFITVGTISGTYPPYHQAMVTRKYSPDGLQVWQQTYTDGPWSAAWALDIDESDNVYVTGSVYTSAYVSQQWAILKYDKDGNLQAGFPVLYDYSHTDAARDIPRGIAVDTDGNFIAVGYRGVAAGNLDWHVRKYDATKTLVWEDTYDGAGGSDLALGVEVDSNGDVFVGGFTYNGTDNDWLIIKYRAADGYRLWTKTFESAVGRSEGCQCVTLDSKENVLAGGYEIGDDAVSHWRLELRSNEDGGLLAEQGWESANQQNIYAVAYRDGRLALGGWENNGVDRDLRAMFGTYVGEKDIVVSPDPVDFDTVILQEFSDLEITVTNTGDTALTIGTIASDDPLAAPFSIVDDDCSGQTISAGGSCTFAVRFSPTEEGDFSDTFDIPSDHPQESPITVDVNGEGVPPTYTTELWSDTYDGGNGHDYVWGVAIDSEGSVISAGHIKGINSPEHHTDAYIKKDPADGSDPLIDILDMGPVAGAKLDSNDSFLDVAVDSEDNIVTVGVISGAYPPYHQAMLVRKYDPYLNLLWQQTHDEFAWSGARGVDIDKDDNIYVTGNVFTSWAVANQWAVLKYDKDGNLLSGFPVRYDFGVGVGTSTPVDLWDVPYDIAVDENGNFIVVGFRGVASGNRDWHVRKYDSSRTLVWEDTYDGNSLRDDAWGVDVDSNGDVIVVGYTNQGTDNGDNANYDWLIIKYKADKDPGGEQRLWTQTFDSGVGSEYCYDVIVDPQDNVLLGGFASDGTKDQWRMERRSSADGSLLAEQVWESDHPARIHGLAYRERRIALCGYENNGTDHDMLIRFVACPPPEITLAGESPMALEVGTAYAEPGWTAMDDFEGELTGDVVVTGTVDHTTLGAYEIRYNVSASNGDPAKEKVRTVNVVDTTAPQITLEGDDPMSLEVGTAYVEPDYSASDNYDGDLTGDVGITGSVDHTTLGEYTLRYNVSDSSGNPAAERTRTVNVVDTAAPEIALLGDNPMSIEIGTAYEEPGFTATDNYDGDISASVAVTGSVDENTPGSYDLQYNVSDSSGNPAAEQVRTVNVIDTTPFTFTEIVGITESIFQLTWESRPGDNFVIWSSTDLLAGWVQVQTIGSQGGTTTWLDPSAGGTMKFYKIERK